MCTFVVFFGHFYSRFLFILLQREAKLELFREAVDAYTVLTEQVNFPLYETPFKLRKLL